MTWGAVAGAAVGVVGSALTSGGGSQTNGGAGTQTQSKEPWAAAQPWIMNNLMQGQNLQNSYTASPFNAQQQAAYGRMGNQTAYMGSLVPSLLGQISGQQLGYNRSNPNARPTAYNFDGNTGMGSGTSAPGSSSPGGLLSMLTSGNNTAANASLNPIAAQQPAAATPGAFVQQDMGDPQLQATIARTGGGLLGNQLYVDPSQYKGAYGSFKYGDPMPQAGTQAYKDMNDYFAYGGADPMNMYGKGQQSPVFDRSGA